jgi:hypothetical protein
MLSPFDLGGHSGEFWQIYQKAMGGICLFKSFTHTKHMAEMSKLCLLGFTGM